MGDRHALRTGDDLAFDDAKVATRVALGRLEVRVRTFKDIEVFINNRVQIGMDPQERLHAVRVQRLNAEAELLALKAEAERPAVMVITLPPVCCCPPPP